MRWQVLVIECDGQREEGRKSGQGNPVKCRRIPSRYPAHGLDKSRNRCGTEIEGMTQDLQRSDKVSELRWYKNAHWYE